MLYTEYRILVIVTLNVILLIVVGPLEKNLPETNTLAYFATPLMTKKKSFITWQIVFSCCVLKSWLQRQILGFELKNKILVESYFISSKNFLQKINITQFWQSECSFPEFQTILLVSNDLCFMDTCWSTEIYSQEVGIFTTVNANIFTEFTTVKPCKRPNLWL